MEQVFSRTKSNLVVGDANATIPEDILALSLLSTNLFIPNGEYKDDGYVYLNKKPIKKWFKNIEDVKVWFPILEDIKKLQTRYNIMKKAYTQYWKETDTPAFNAVVKVKEAHVKVTHKFTGGGDPWWLYTASERGISFDWVEKPENPIHLKIGTRYYKTSKRLEQLGRRVNMFRVILLSAIRSKVYKIKGNPGDMLQVKVLDSVYWFLFGIYTWELITANDNFKTIEL